MTPFTFYEINIPCSLFRAQKAYAPSRNIRRVKICLTDDDLKERDVFALSHFYRYSNRWCKYRVRLVFRRLQRKAGSLLPGLPKIKTRQDSLVQRYKRQNCSIYLIQLKPRKKLTPFNEYIFPNRSFLLSLLRTREIEFCSKSMIRKTTNHNKFLHCF